MSDSFSDYYEQDQYNSIERATLAEAVTFSNIAPVKAKFFFSAVMPKVDKSSTAETITRKGVTKTNFIEMTIPAHIIMGLARPNTYLMNGKRFLYLKNSYTIPKGSVFYVEMRSGSMEYQNAVIIAAAASTTAS